MKEFIVYATEGTTYGPNVEVAVENCQGLGIGKAHTKEEAVAKIFRDNKWVEEAGFSKDYVVVRQLESESL